MISSTGNASAEKDLAQENRERSDGELTVGERSVGERAVGKRSDGEPAIRERSGAERSAPLPGPSGQPNEPQVPKSIRRLAGQAIVEFGMIRANDRILVGLSGGKDSLTLLWLFRNLMRRAPVRFEIGAVTINPEIPGFDPAPLRAYLASHGIPYFFVSEPIADLASQHMGKDSFCAFCARMKRGLMYRTARNEGYNVLALGQHLDDLAESFLMSAFHGGQLRTMQAHYRIDAGDLRVIRPLVYVRERQTRDFAQAAKLPVINDNCPACFRHPTQREHMKDLLAREEVGLPRLFRNLRTALTPLLGRPGGPDGPDRLDISAGSVAPSSSVDLVTADSVAPGSSVDLVTANSVAPGSSVDLVTASSVAPGSSVDLEERSHAH